MDLTKALAPKSDQLDFADLEGQPPQVFTITSVSENGSELADQQPVNIGLAEFPRVWRPSKGMLRVLADNWGKKVEDWVGRQVELYGDPEVYFGREKRGGTRISRLSHIPKSNTTQINPRGGKGAFWKVDPLPQQAPAPAQPPAEPMTAETRDRFFALFDEVHPTPKTSRQQAQLDYIGQALGYGVPAPSLSVVTEAQLQAVVAALEAEKAQQASEQLPVEGGEQS